MTSNIKFKMDSNDKEVLEAMLKDMGLDLGTAFRMFAYKVLKTGEIPFSISSSIEPDAIWTKEEEANGTDYSSKPDTGISLQNWGESSLYSAGTGDWGESASAGG